MKPISEYAFNKRKHSGLSGEHHLNNFSAQQIERIHAFQKTHYKYEETPLNRLTNLANHLELGAVYVKDESHRFGLNAFKVLGGIYAIGRYLAKLLNRDIETLSFKELQSETVKGIIGEQTFVSATDGNHGKGVAWAARELGHQAIIYLPKGVAKRRIEAIENQGAKAIVTEYNYDDSVRLAAKNAKDNGWIVLQDTSWAGYEEIPLWIMQGYASLAKETISQLEMDSNVIPTHLFLQVGVGSYAASIAAYFINYYKGNHPKIILIEPEQANCYYKSIISEQSDYQIVDGDLDTIMAGLSCGEPNPYAWNILKRYTEIAFSVDDRMAALGMRVLGHPTGTDKRIIAGESGAVPAGLLYSLAKLDELKDVKNELGVNNTSQIVMINTEGDTDPEHYKRIVWEGAYPL